MMQAENCLTRAEALINGPRRSDYGPIEKSAIDVSRIWSSLLGTEVTPEKYLLCMAAMKIYRECVSHKQDNIDDACGYLALTEQVIKALEQQKT